MSRYRVELAANECDAQLRRLSAVPMPGQVSLSFRREPNYFSANCVLGPNCQTIVGWDQRCGEAIGLATRSVRECYVDGRPTRVGFLNGLRLAPHVRNVGLLARGYAFLRQLHEEDKSRPDFYLTTIAEGNHTALRVLTSERAGLPKYTRIGTLHTLALPKWRRCRQGTRLVVARAGSDDVDAAVEFLNQQGPQYDFFPVYRSNDFIGSQRLFRGLNQSDLLVIRRAGRIVGLVGLWDQSAFRQTVIERYGRLLGLARPAYNVWARMTSGLALPRPGSQLRQRFAAFPIAENADAEVLQRLLDALVASRTGADFTCIGLCDNHPLLARARRYAAHEYRTNIYAVSWEPLPPTIGEYSSRLHYLELGCL